MRIRTIKPEFFRHEDLFDAEEETKLPLRLAFIGLWCASDREGRFKWRPRTLKSEILPFDEVDFSRVLDALATRGFIVKYASDTGEFGHIPSFKTHQVINNRERDSILPDPLNCKESDACLTRDPRVTHAGKGEGKGREGKGKEQDSCPQADEKALLLEIWNLAPSKSRTRSSKKKVFDAWKRIPKQSRPTPLDLITAIKAWSACEDWTKEGGQYAPGLHLWIKDQKWEDLPEGPTTSTPKPPTDTGPEGWQDAFRQLHPDWLMPAIWYHVDLDIREEIQNHLNTKQP
jgi:hypothetical protein